VNNHGVNNPATGLTAVLAILAILAFAAAVRHGLRQPAPEQVKDPVAEAIGSRKPIPAHLRQYRESLPPIDPELKQVRGIALDAADRIYVAGDSKVVVFTAEGRALDRITLGFPAECIAVDADGRLLLGVGNRVEALSCDGRHRATWDGFGQDARITSLAVGSQAVFVADAGNRCIWKCGADGNIERVFGPERMRQDGHSFIVPSPFFDVALSADGVLWAANPGRLRVEKMSADDGVTLTTWGRATLDIDGFCGCCNPTHLALTPDGHLVTSEKGLARVKVSDMSGQLLAVVADPTQFSRNVKGLDLAVASDGRILVLDPSASRVRVFVSDASMPSLRNPQPQ